MRNKSRMHSKSCSVWREAKKSNREEKEKFEIIFSNFERRRRNLTILSPVLRREREIWKKILNFREEKEKGIFFSQASKGERESEKRFTIFEKRQRNLKCCSPTLRREREIWKQILDFWEEKEKWIYFSQASRGEREFWKLVLQMCYQMFPQIASLRGYMSHWLHLFVFSPLYVFRCLFKWPAQEDAKL